MPAFSRSALHNEASGLPIDSSIIGNYHSHNVLGNKRYYAGVITAVGDAGYDIAFEDGDEVMEAPRDMVFPADTIFMLRALASCVEAGWGKWRRGRG